MVLPSISPLSGTSVLGAQSVDVPPPLKFKPLIGKPRNISIGAARVQTQIHASMSAAKANGIRYEWQVYGWLTALLASKDQPLHVQHCIHFSDDSGYRTVIPDAFTVFEDCVFLFEVKSQHMPEAWWQCEKLYKPLLEGFFQKPVFCVEIVKKFDTQMPFPVPIYYITNLIEYLDRVVVWPADWGVLKWRKGT
jgi:hypothetical protein